MTNNTTTPELIEKVARAIFKQRYLAANPDAVLSHGAKAWQVCQLDAQAAIAALADHQSAAEPVAWMYGDANGGPVFFTFRREDLLEKGFAETPLYAAPQPAPLDDRLPTSSTVDDGGTGVGERQVEKWEVNDEFERNALRLAGISWSQEVLDLPINKAAKLSILAHAATLHKLAVAREALEAARQFIENGIEFGFIRMPNAETPDSAHDTPALIFTALAQIKDTPA